MLLDMARPAFIEQVSIALEGAWPVLVNSCNLLISMIHLQFSEELGELK